MVANSKLAPMNTNDWQMEQPRAVHALSQANQAVRSRIDNELSTMNMTSIQHTVLSTIGKYAGLSSADLARRFFVTPQTMNELIGSLHRRGLITRQEDPTNRRILRMSLTLEGKRMIKVCDAAVDGIERDVFSSIPQEHYLLFREFCQELARNLRGPEHFSRSN